MQSYTYIIYKNKNVYTLHSIMQFLEGYTLQGNTVKLNNRDAT